MAFVEWFTDVTRYEVHWSYKAVKSAYAAWCEMFEAPTVENGE